MRKQDDGIFSIKARKNEHVSVAGCGSPYDGYDRRDSSGDRVVGNIGFISHLWWGERVTVVGSTSGIYDLTRSPNEIFVSENICMIGEIARDTFLCASTIVDIGDVEVGYTTGYYNEKERTQNYRFKSEGAEIFANSVGSAKIRSFVRVIPREYFDIGLAIREAMDPEEIKKKCRSYRPKG
ncbi:hypothetical protein KAT63_01340 [Candidatus Parcubacteria bacterium]|nr:hypothetical protein [Candidatus Parcubacteria bacterium]